MFLMLNFAALLEDEDYWLVGLSHSKSCNFGLKQMRDALIIKLFPQRR